MIVIIDYGVGNLGSIANMFKKIGVVATISSDPTVIAQADKLVLPGVGAFDNGMQNLHNRNLVEILNQRVLDAGVPILGLCIGMQLFAQRSEEGQLPGLGWLEAEVVRFKFEGSCATLKIPHMGWNIIFPDQAHPIVYNLESNARFYFVHSYHLVCKQTQNVIARVKYGYDFAAIVGRDNILGAQFHPEKSHKFGMQLFRNFVERV
jgi:glutamine amidotransferase